MALNTKCKFYFGVVIEQDSNYFDFDDGAGEVSFSIPSGYYSPTEIVDIVSSNLNSVGSKSYSCYFNRQSRSVVISCTSNFKILIATGKHSGATIYKSIGFTSLFDLIGNSSYTSNLVIGIEYRPQFYLLDYIPLGHNIKSVQASINETGSGSVEVIKYGTKRFLEFSIELITNRIIHNTQSFESSITAVDDVLTFLNFAISKSKIEFMEDVSNVEKFNTIILESTEADQNGVGFKLQEQLDYGEGFYKTGKLVFREVTQ